MGSYVIIVNAEKVVVSGNKASQKIYTRHTGRPGSRKEETIQKLQAVRSSKAPPHVCLDLSSVLQCGHTGDVPGHISPRVNRKEEKFGSNMSFQDLSSTLQLPEDHTGDLHMHNGHPGSRKAGTFERLQGCAIWLRAYLCHVAVSQCGTGSVPGMLLSMLAACTGLEVPLHCSASVSWS